MRVRIPIAQGDDGEPTTKDGNYEFVIIDTEQISHIRREAESRHPPGVRMPGPAPDSVLYTETTITMIGGEDIVFKDSDLCAGWTHDALLRALDYCDEDGYPGYGWNPTEAVPTTPKPKKSKRAARRT